MATASTGPSELHAGQALPPYRVRAVNGAASSENKIHDDTVARQYGFAGGLVPGVTVYAYMTRPVLAAFGDAWLERGRMSARFFKPFYDGESVTVHATVSRVAADGCEIVVEAVNDAGEVRASGTASLPATASEPPALDAFPAAPLPVTRLAPTPEALRDVTILGTVDERWQPEERETAAYLEEITPADESRWRGPGAIAHPAYLLRRGNLILSKNVALGPWIHVSSDVQHFGLVHAGDALATRGRITALFERKGHQFADLDIVVVAAGRPVLRAKHTAIYAPRKGAE